MALPLTTLHRRRLREVWRSAGWPCRDALELDLLAAGLLHRHLDLQGRETLHVSDAGLQVLAATLERNRRAFDAHEALVARVALEMQRAGRVVWRGLTLRVPLPAACGAQPVASATACAQTGPLAPGGGRRWVNAMPDVFSIRHTTVEDYAEPVVHEIKVRRADLLADVRRADKGAAYCAMASQCWYVLAPGIGTADDVPAACGVMLAEGSGFTVLRPAPRRPMRLPFAVWMALARANAEPPADSSGQDALAAQAALTPSAVANAGPPDVAVLAPWPDAAPATLARPPQQPTTPGAAPGQAPTAAASS